MAKAQCEAGHFYDLDQFKQCPHCIGTLTIQNTHNLHSDKYDDEPISSGVSVEFEQSIISSDVWNSPMPKTTMEANNATAPVVGWLVAVSGCCFGQDFRLKEGLNNIGRSAHMDVPLTGDMAVSREKHAIIKYDSTKNEFNAMVGSSRELYYVNGQVVLRPIVLNRNDILNLGESELLFVPLCSKDFIWPKG